MMEVTSGCSLLPSRPVTTSRIALPGFEPPRRSVTELLPGLYDAARTGTNLDFLLIFCVTK